MIPKWYHSGRSRRRVRLPSARTRSLDYGPRKGSAHDSLACHARGINVGTHNRVPMKDLKLDLKQAGYGDVVTVGQSGNIVLCSELSEADINAAVSQLLEDAYGVRVPVTSRSAEEISEVLAKNPLADVAEDGSKYIVIFLSEDPGKEKAAELMAEDHSPETVYAEGRTVWVYTPDGVKAMTFSQTALEKRFNVVATARNVNTLEKIAAKLLTLCVNSERDELPARRTIYTSIQDGTGVQSRSMGITCNRSS